MSTFFPIRRTFRHIINYTCQRGFKVALLGAMSSVGQPLSAMLKLNRHLEAIAVQDHKNDVKGLAMELNSINVGCPVTSHQSLKGALKDADFVMIAGGKNCCGITSDVQKRNFYENCRTVYECTKACSQFCPRACLCVLTGPQHSTVPIACETYKNCLGKVEHKVLGVSGHQVMKAKQIFSDHLDVNPATLPMTVIGGCSPKTSVPILSKMGVEYSMPIKSRILMTKYIQQQQHKNGQQQKSLFSPLSLACAADRLVQSLCKSSEGKKNIVEHAFVRWCCPRKGRYFYCSMPVLLGHCGLKHIPGIPQNLDFYEQSSLMSALESVDDDVLRGLEAYQVLEKDRSNKMRMRL